MVRTYTYHDAEKEQSGGDWGPPQVFAGPDETVSLTRSHLQLLLKAMEKATGTRTLGNENMQPLQVEDVNVQAGQTPARLPPWADRETALVYDSSDCGSPNSKSSGSLLSRRTTSNPELSSKVHLSKLEQKRLQWQKEQAETQEWHPWGRPGAGAPRRGSQAVAAVAPTPRKEAQIRRDSSVSYASSSGSTLHLSSASNTIYGTTTPADIHAVIPFDQLDSNSIPDDTRDREGDWLREIEQDERYTRKLPAAQPNTGQEFGNYHLQGSETPVSSLGITPPQSAASSLRGFRRGRIFSSDPEASAEHDKQRNKVIEYQQAIKAQVEENKRRREEEKARRQQEELREEEKLEKERQKILAQYELEEQKRREKVLQNEKKQQAALAAIQSFSDQAKSGQRTSRKQLHVEETGINLPLVQNNTNCHSSEGRKVDTESTHHSARPASLTTRENSISTKSSSDSACTSVLRIAETSSIEKPSHTSSSRQTDTSATRETGTQVFCNSSSSDPVEHSPYTENRVLTPTKLRSALQDCSSQQSQGRNFGTQTEVSIPAVWSLNDESPESIGTSLQKCAIEHRRQRLQHSQPTRAFRTPMEDKANAPLESSAGSAVHQHHLFVKMSERNPYYHKRKKLLELRKQHWEMERARRPFQSVRGNLTGKAHSQDSSDGDNSSSYESDSRSSPILWNASMRPLRTTVKHEGHFPGHFSADDVKMAARNETNLQMLLGKHCGRIGFQHPERLCSDTEELTRSHNSQQKARLPSQSNLFPSALPSRWHSQENLSRPVAAVVAQCSTSPPVPAVTRKLSHSLEHDAATHSHTSRRKWSRDDSFDIEAIAREAAQWNDDCPEYEGNKSASLGSGDEQAETVRRRLFPADPLAHPEVVRGRPTPRQGKILQELSSIRKSLMMKQQELENFRSHTS